MSRRTTDETKNDELKDNALNNDATPAANLTSNPDSEPKSNPDDGKNITEKEPETDKPSDKGIKTLVLVKAASFTGRGVKNVKKGIPFHIDANTAELLMETGLFKKEG